MKIFIVHAHAGPGSFNGALFQTAQDTLRAAILDRRWAKAEIVKAETLKCKWVSPWPFRFNLRQCG